MVQHWNSATSKSETVNSATLNSAMSKCAISYRATLNCPTYIIMLNSAASSSARLNSVA